MNSPEIVAAAERQMHAWAMLEERQNRAVRHEAEDQATRRAVRFVTISREAGAGGGEIGGASANGWDGRSSTRTSWIASPIVSISPA